MTQQNTDAMTREELDRYLAERYEAKCDRCLGSGNPHKDGLHADRCWDCNGTGRVKPWQQGCLRCEGDRAVGSEPPRHKRGDEKDANQHVPGCCTRRR